MQFPETRYATTEDGVHIAYQVAGTGSLDVLLVDTWVHHVEAVWDFPDFARFLRRLASFGRLIHFDRRGTGLSDPVPLDRLPDLEKQMEDAVAVLEEVGSTRSWPAASSRTAPSSRWRTTSSTSARLPERPVGDAGHRRDDQVVRERMRADVHGSRM